MQGGGLYFKVNFAGCCWNSATEAYRRTDQSLPCYMTCLLLRFRHFNSLEQGPRSNFEIEGAWLNIGGGGGKIHFFLQTLYNFNNIGGHMPPPLPPLPLLHGPCRISIDQALEHGGRPDFPGIMVTIERLHMHAGSTVFELFFALQ